MNRNSNLILSNLKSEHLNPTETIALNFFVSIDLQMGGRVERETVIKNKVLSKLYWFIYNCNL